MPVAEQAVIWMHVETIGTQLRRLRSHHLSIATRSSLWIVGKPQWRLTLTCKLKDKLDGDGDNIVKQRMASEISAIFFSTENFTF